MRSKNLNLRVPRLGVNRFGVYYVRSSTTDASGRKKVIQRSLGTKNTLIAKLAALKFCSKLIEEDVLSKLNPNGQAYEIDVLRGTIKSDGAEDHALAMQAVKDLSLMESWESAMRQRLSTPEAAPSLPQPQPVVTAPSLASNAGIDAILATAQMLGHMPKPLDVGMSLTKAMNDHLEEEEGRVASKRTVKEKKALYEEFQAFFGDVYLNQITLQDITERWNRAEIKRPSQNVSRAKKAEQQAAIAKGETPKVVTLSLSRREKRRGYLALFFDWAKAGGIYMHDVNPMSQKIAKKRDIRAATVPHAEFTSADLAMLFNKEYGASMVKPDHYWLPVMALYSGARIGEIANIKVDRFSVVDDIHVYLIGPGKTPKSTRTVPIHPVLMDLGLWDYAMFLKEKGEQHLFWFRPEDIRSKSTVDYWGKWVDKCKITDPNKVFHSFRSTVITDMYDVDAPNAAAIRDSVGHTGGTSGAHGGYIRGAALRRIRDTIYSLNYPSVNVDDIRCPDPTFARYYASEKARQTNPKYAEQRRRRKEHAAVMAERAKRIASSKKR